MRRSALLTAFLFVAVIGASPAAAQSASSERDVTRSRLASILAIAGARSDVNVAFQQSTKNPYNFVGKMTGLTNCDMLEVVWGVGTSGTVSLRAYCHYKGNYINLGRARDPQGLMRRLLYFNDQNFLYWGADGTGDVFTAYSFTLESGFPDDAIVIVNRSLRNTDGFVGQLRPMIDGSTAPAK
jgi:hypothetical protein